MGGAPRSTNARGSIAGRSSLQPFADGFARAFAEARVPPSTSLRVVGARTVAVDTVGGQLATLLGRSLIPAVADHLAPALRLQLWDVEATGVAPPDGPAFPAVAERHGAAGERFAVTADHRTVRHHGPGFDVRFARDEGRAIGWVASPAALSAWHRARPLQTLLLPWLADLGMVVVHAAMVARGGVGALVVGPSGRGKSTTAAACAEAGMSVLGDDAIAVERAGTAWSGHCLHAAIKLRTPPDRSGAGLASRAEPCGPPWEGESVLHLPEAAPTAVAATAAIVAVLLPELSDAPGTSLTAVTAGRSLAGLTGAALSLEPGGVAAGFELLSGLASDVPALTLAIGRETTGIPLAIDALVARLSSG